MIRHLRERRRRVQRPRRAAGRHPYAVRAANEAVGLGAERIVRLKAHRRAGRALVETGQQ